MELNKIYQGDCLVELKKLPDNSIDSVVTDPPYGISFMGKKWDYQVPKIEVWQECLRVLKPGGHALVACGTRTQHRMAVNIEDAGFEIRDIVAWVYGGGFPKSHNIGKAVDKIQGNERKVVGEIRAGKNAMGQDSGWNAHKNKTVMDSTKGSSPYEGWGTALKPAMELWTLCRKPLEEKTIAKNVLKHGTGGINIDGCRVEAKPRKTGTKPTSDKATGSGNTLQGSSKNRQAEYDKQSLGRFPANLIHDGSDEVVSRFPNSKSTGGSGKASQKTAPNDIYGKYKEGYKSANLGGLGDSGSAPRFFYCAKASKSERNKGLEGLPDVDGGHYRQDEWSRQNMGNTPDVERKPVKNNHPTVKPVSLMRYLCKLITPPEGIVLDPFLGSGTTAVAANMEGFSYVGIELDKDYIKIAEKRLAQRSLL